MVVTPVVKSPPGAVRIRVRVRGSDPSIGWAGEVWTQEWREFDAHPIHVEDLRADKGRLVIEWPDGYKFKDGTSPSDPVAAIVGEEQHGTTADAVAAAKSEAIYHATRAAAADHEVNELRTSFAALSRDTEDRVAAVTEKLRMAERNLVQSEVDRVALNATLSNSDTAIGVAVSRVQSECRAEIDTALAKCATDIAATKADADALIAAASSEITRLTSEIDALKIKLAAVPVAEKSTEKPVKGNK